MKTLFIACALYVLRRTRLGVLMHCIPFFVTEGVVGIRLIMSVAVKNLVLGSCFYPTNTGICTDYCLHTCLFARQM